MKVLVVGDWHSEVHEEAVYQALQKLGHEPLRFAWHHYFQPTGVIGKLGLPLLKAQNKYMVGPLTARLNHDLLVRVTLEQPDMVFVYRGTHICRETLRRIRIAAPRAVLVGYNNDDPFSPRYPTWKWRHFLRSVPEYDLVLAYRSHNIEEFKAAGARRVELLRSWFVPERNYPIELSDAERARFGCDVVFVGHYEEDGRLECLEEIARTGWHLRIFGPGYEWDPILRRSSLLREHVPVRLVWGEDYNQALCGAKVALCFFSKLNRDTYTRRCFEIPASGAVLMSEYSDDLARLYRGGEEAAYFASVAEMRIELQRLLTDEALRSQIAAAGMRRVWHDGHDVVSRMRNVVGWANEIAGDSK